MVRKLVVVAFLCISHLYAQTPSSAMDSFKSLQFYWGIGKPRRGAALLDNWIGSTKVCRSPRANRATDRDEMRSLRSCRMNPMFSAKEGVSCVAF